MFRKAVWTLGDTRAKRNLQGRVQKDFRQATVEQVINGGHAVGRSAHFGRSCW